MSSASGDCSERSSETWRADWSHRWALVWPALPCACGWKLAAREAYRGRTLVDHVRDEIAGGFRKEENLLLRECEHVDTNPPQRSVPHSCSAFLRGSPFRRSTRMLDERRAYKRRAPQRMLDRHAMVATPTSADSASLARGRSRSSQKALPWFASSSYRYFINNRQPKGSLSNVLSRLARGEVRARGESRRR